MLLFFFRRYYFILLTFWSSQHIISIYCDSGCSWSNSLYSVTSCHLLRHLPICSLVSLVFVLTSASTCILFIILSSGIRCKWSNQINLCVFLCFIIFLCLINSSNSSIKILLRNLSQIWILVNMETKPTNAHKCMITSYTIDTVSSYMFGPFSWPSCTLVQ
jgi:hypothetical protein